MRSVAWVPFLLSSLLLACAGEGGAAAPPQPTSPPLLATATARTPPPTAVPTQPPPSATPTPAAAPPTAPAAALAPTATPGGVGGGSLLLRAKNLAFLPQTLTTRSGQTVTISFVNEDASVAHDVVVRAPGAGEGALCTGPCSYTLTFTAPAPGTYRFVCTVHESIDMQGTLVVTP